MSYFGNIFLSLRFFFPLTEEIRQPPVLPVCTILCVSSRFGYTLLMDVSALIFDLELTSSDRVLDRLVDSRN